MARIQLLLRSAADPDSALDYIERFQRQAPQDFSRLIGDDAAIQSLIAVFTHSQFLSEKLLQHPDWLESLLRHGDLYKQLSAEDIEAQFLDGSAASIPDPLNLATFRRIGLNSKL